MDPRQITEGLHNWYIHFLKRNYLLLCAAAIPSDTSWTIRVQFLLCHSDSIYYVKIHDSGLARKRKADMWSPLALFYPRWVVSYRWSKNNILASLCLASYLAANWLQKLKMKHAYYTEVISVLMCVCLHVCVWYGISVWFIYNKTKLTFCKMLVFVPYNTSLQCSNQPLRKLNLMTGVNMTKQQTGEIKNTI